MYGIIFRDQHGTPECAVMVKEAMNLGAEFAEAKAIFRALQIALDKGFMHICVESNCQRVVNIIKG